MSIPDGAFLNARKDELEDLTIGILNLLDNVKMKYGSNAIVHIRVDDYGVTVYDVVTNKLVYDADTMPEFTFRFG